MQERRRFKWALIERCCGYTGLYTSNMQRGLFAAALMFAITVMADLKVSTTYAQEASVVVPTFRSAMEAADELPRLYSLLVSQRGTIVLEQYFNRPRATTPANVKSVSKSVFAARV